MSESNLKKQKIQPQSVWEPWSNTTVPGPETADASKPLLAAKPLVFDPSSDTESFEAYIKRLYDTSEKNIIALSKKEATGRVAKPFSSEMAGDKLRVCIPLNVKSDDALANIILFLSTHLDGIELVTIAQGWNEPDFDMRTNKSLNGLLSLLSSPPPKTLGTRPDKDPTSLIQWAYWVKACQVAVTHQLISGQVSAEIFSYLEEGDKFSGGQKYINQFQKWLTTSLDENPQVVETLSTLMNLWVRKAAAYAPELISSKKLKWMFVERQSFPVDKEARNKKGKPIFKLKIPKKPSGSTWLAEKEKTFFNELVTPLWATRGKMITKWKELPAKEQHAQWKTYVKGLKTWAKQVRDYRAEIVPKIAHRKKYIIETISNSDSKPNKKDAAFMGKWAALFYQKERDLTTLTPEAKAVFCPLYVIGDYDDYFSSLSIKSYDDLRDECAMSGHTVLPKAMQNWMIFWLNRFKPVWPTDEGDPLLCNPTTIRTFNKFQLLAPFVEEAEETEEAK